MIDRPLKIAFVVDRFGGRFGGAEAYGVELMRQLSHDHDITVFAREYDPGCDVRLPFVPIKTRKGLSSWIRVLMFARRASALTHEGFDIVHSHMNGWCGDIEVVHVTPVRFNWRVKPMGWFKRVMSHISPRVQTYLRLEALRVAERPGHRVVAVSSLIADQLQQAYGKNRVFPVIPPGVTSPDGTRPEQRGALRQSFGWSQTDVVCLLVARNPLRKGLPTALQALSSLPEKFKLLVVGGNGSVREFVSREAPDLAARVQIVGETSDVGPYYASADIYVHPTLNDSFGMAPLEAMSYGLPVILSPAPWCGFAQYVKDGTEALLLSHPENARELAQYISQLDADAALHRSLVQGAAAVVARHGWAEVAARYLELYDQVLSETAGTSGRVCASR